MSVITRKRNARVNRPRRKVVERKPFPWRSLALGGFSLLVIVAGIAGLGRLLDRPVVIQVGGGGQRVSELDIRAALAAYDGAGFLAVDLDSVRAAAEALPWVDRARVERAFPAQLRVIVTEQVAAARWGDKGLLNTRGELFISDARFGFPELPGLAGPTGSEWRVAQRYLEVHKLITPLGFDVKSLRLSERGAWAFTLDSGLQIRLGRKQTRQRLLRFANVVVPQIQDLQLNVAYVDLRYSNGFAIGWRDGEPPQDKSDGEQELSANNAVEARLALHQGVPAMPDERTESEPI